MYTDYKIYLASGSPRRRELLSMLGVEFSRPESIDVDETYPEDMPAEDVPEYLAVVKAMAYRDRIRPGELFITADTVVILDGNLLGKPRDEQEAVSMLKRLRGRYHWVITGVCLTTVDRMERFSVTTEVVFGDLTDEEITGYVTEFRPFDKAGAYGIQERIGAMGVKEIIGSYYNVMGLPVHRLYQELKTF
ncbi:MAG: Maf family nucleotide pyrophosphatase [Clostridium sp.]|nr:Maf family nucleotide pyrophosphatase [Clostridium sp.]